MATTYRSIYIRVFNLIALAKNKEKKYESADSFPLFKEKDIESSIWEILNKIVDAKKNSSPDEIKKLKKLEDVLAAIVEQDKIKFAEIYALSKLLK